MSNPILDQTLINEIGERKNFNFKQASARLAIFTDDTARVSSVLSRNKGHGEATELMRKICKYADEHDLYLFLTVQQYGDPRQGMSNDQLVSFYSRFGFTVVDKKKPVLMERVSQE